MNPIAVNDFMPHGYCLFWEPGLVWLHVLSDILTGTAYYAIALAMTYILIKKRHDLPFSFIFSLFALFIFACGTTHYFAAYTIYKPAYWPEGVVKGLTAFISIVAALLFIPKLPAALAMPSLPAALAEVKVLNERMAAQMVELKESRDKYSALIETTGTAFAIMDERGVLLDANDAYVRLTGYASQSEILGRSVTEWISGHDRQKNDLAVKACLERGQIRNLEIDYVDRNGSIVPVEINATVVSIKGVPHIFALCFDITDRKLATEKTLSSLREKEVLLREVHHRVKNNLAIISSLLSLQTNFVVDPKYMQMFKESQSRIKSMALVHEKLYKQEEFSNINVRDYVESLYLGIKTTFAGDRNVDVNMEIEDIMMDMDSLIPCGLILNELLTNAFKHAFDGLDRILVSISLKRLSDGMLQLIVSDDGKGLPEGFDMTDTKGLGFMLILSLVGQLDGSIETPQFPRATFCITFEQKIRRT